MWIGYKLWYAGLDRFFTIALLVVGIVFVVGYATAPETLIASPLHGFAIATNQRLTNLTKVALSLDVKSGLVSVSGEWTYFNHTQDAGRSFKIVFVLPFTIIMKNPDPTYGPIPTTDNWKWNDTNVTKVAASEVTVTFSGNDIKSGQGYFYAEFIVAKTYANSQRGSYFIALPLDAGVDGPYFPSLISTEWNANVTCCILPNELDVVITFPSSAVNI